MRKDSPLERYISILEAVAPFDDGLTRAQLEDILDLPTTSLNRLLQILHESGLVKINRKKGRSFELGERMVRIIQSASGADWLEAATKKILQELADMTGQSAYIAEFNGREIRTLHCYRPEMPYHIHVMPSQILPIHATAAGKAILAFQDRITIDRILAQPFERYTDKTIMQIPALKQELEQVRTFGAATDFGEYVSDIATIAKPIVTNENRVFYAVCLTGPKRVIKKTMRSLLHELDMAADHLSKFLMKF